MTKHIIKILAFLIFIQSSCSVPMENYPYGPKIVELEGVLELEDRFGSPNYGETPSIDERLVIYVFRLKAPITVGTRETLSQLNDSVVTDVDKVQLVFLNRRPQAGLLGKDIIIRGTLAKAIWGRHFYPVVFSVSFVGDQ